MKAIAMWSGPRNISTAMMRSWENRPDTKVVDEPLYAYYLKTTRIIHPGNEEVLASQPNDWQSVAAELTQPFSDAEIYYQKHMSHHLLDEIELAWLDKLTNCFLIRDPRYVVASYSKARDEVIADDLGFRQQVKLFNYLRDKNGVTPLVIDSHRFLENPKSHQEKICQQLDIPFYEEMLQWPKGKRDSDGVWAPYWYETVEKSTCFQPFTKKTISLKKHQAAVVEECKDYYQQLIKYAIN